MAAGTVTIKIIGDASSFKKAVGDTESATGRLQAAGQKMQAVGAKMTAAVSLPLVAALGAATKAAADEEQEMAVLAKTLKNTTGATDDQVAAVEKWITATQNATGVADGELRPALGKLLIAGRSVEQAQKDMAVALDIAAARGKPVSTIIEAMSKAAQGNVGAFGRLGIATKNAAGETLTYDEILKNASETMGGAAAAAADTAAGRAAILKAKMADLTESIGAALIPILDTLTGVLSKVAAWFTNLSPTMQKTVVIGAALLAALGPLVALIGTLTTVVGGLGKALMFVAANPVVLIIAAIAALAAGLVYAYNNCETFQHIVESAFDAVMTAARFLADVVGTAFTWIKDHINYVLIALGPLGIAIRLLKDNWEAVWNAITKAIEVAWSVIEPIIDAVKAGIDALIGAKDFLFGSGFDPEGFLERAEEAGVTVPTTPTSTSSGSGETLTTRTGPKSAVVNMYGVKLDADGANEVAHTVMWELGRVG